MTTIAERVKQKRIELGLTQTELALLVGITQQSLQKIEDGRTQNPRKLLNLAKALNSDPEWLLLGSNEEIKEISAYYNNNLPIEQKNNLRPVIDNDQIAHHPISELLKKDEMEWIYASLNVSDTSFWLTVIGDSMTSASGLSVPEDYLILVEPNLTAKNGDLVVAKMEENNEITFKQLVIDIGRTYLRPLNTHYRPTEVTMAFHIIGVVVEAKLTFK